jgi:Toxin co-regulated pilus biosynthesis protein Q
MKAPVDGAPMNIAQKLPQNDPVLPRHNTVSRMNGSAVNKGSVAQQSAWSATAGEDMKVVLSRWALQAGYDLDWQASQGGKVVRDLRLNGSFEDAVAQLMAENSAGTGVGGYIETGKGVKELPSALSAAQHAPTGAQWSGPSGANLQTVLDDWGRKAGVTVIWDGYASIPLKNAIALNGTFEEAVQTLLDQYQNDPARPTGQLNQDPDSGERILIMSLDNAS